MSSFTPYSYIQCPCTETGNAARGSQEASTAEKGETAARDDDDDDEDENTFDPRAPRANYTLYPLEHLLYCEDCHQIRCPRCVLEEIVTWYCPNCLFEVPSSAVKSDGNRCTRSCFQCPICTAPLSVSSLEPQPEVMGSEYGTLGGPFVLNCGFCLWSSKEIGIKFDKANSIYSQISKIRNGGQIMSTPRDRHRDQRNALGSPLGMMSSPLSDAAAAANPPDPDERLDIETHFANLKSFYGMQIAESTMASAGLGASLSMSGDYGFGSPAALSRILGIYTGSSFGEKKSRAKSALMREAADTQEGLQTMPPTRDADTVARLQAEGWNATSTPSQRAMQPTPNPHFLSDLRPLAYLLRTKRSKRCKTCKHILAKPESKVQNTRFRIRLVAQNTVPGIAIRPLQASQPGAASSSLTLWPELKPLHPIQFLLTFKNPLFDPVKITLATAPRTPGPLPSTVTILCPQFEVGANTDMWDEALGGGGGGEGGGSKDPSSSSDRRRTRTELSMLGGQTSSSSGATAAEAGKIWERGRNWVTVVVEVVPGSLDPLLNGRLASLGPHQPQPHDHPPHLREDEDILEIPLFVRMEWDTSNDDGAAAGMTAGGARERDRDRERTSAVGGEKELKEHRELAYWCVLGVGRISV